LNRIIKFEDNPVELASIRNTVYLCVLLLTVGKAFPQSKPTLQSSYSFQHITPSNGLASNVVNDVIQDEEGYMWIATISGLQRYDGNRFLSFRHEAGNPHSIPHNHIEALLLDKDKNLWILTVFGQIGTFDKKKFNYKPSSTKVKDENTLRGAKFLFDDADGNLFLHLIPHELLTFKKSTNEFSASNNFISIPDRWRVWSIIPDKNNKNYWMAGDSGIAMYNAATKQLNYRGHNPGDVHAIDDLSEIRFASQLRLDSKNRIWFITWSTITGAGPFVYCFDPFRRGMAINKLSLYTFLQSYHETSPIFEQKNGKLWLFGLPFLAEFEEKKKQFHPIPNHYLHEQSISFEKVHSLFEDKEENIWIATSDNGIFLFNPSAQLFNSVTHLNRLSNLPGREAVLSFIETDNRQLLVGVWGEGIYRYDHNMNNIPVAIKGIDENIYSAWNMQRKSNGEIWMGLQGGMILVYDQVQGHAKIYTPPIIQARTIRQLAEDKFGNMWLGTHSIGLFKWNAHETSKKFEDRITAVPGIPRTLIHKMIVDSKGFLWVCTIVDGIYKIDTRTDSVVEHITSKGPPGKRLLDNSVGDVMEYNDSTILIVSTGLNIYNTRRNQITHITNAEGLPSPYIMCIQKDKSGNLWLGLINGLCRLDLQKRNFSYYDRTDGIRNDKFIVSSSYLLKDGRLLFGTRNDFIVFDPDKARSTAMPPFVSITDIKLSASSLKLDSIQKLPELDLHYSDKSISIDFASLSYLKKNKLSYYYKLEGIDKDWIAADNTQRAVYTYLPSGSYTFMVRAKNMDGVFSQQLTTLKLKVNPPFWKTWWFLGLVIIALVVFLYWLDQQRMNRIKATESIRTRIATSLTEDMTNSISSINISSELAKTKVDKDAERTKEYISQISDTSNRMVQAMYDMVWSIHPDNDTMQHTIDRMKAFAADIESAYNTDIVFDIGKSVSKLELDMEFRYELLSVFKEAIMNAAKHADARHIQVVLQFRKRLLRMSIEDDGKGFDLESVVMGRGINDMRRRTSAINATLKIKSYINTGTIIKVETKV
jgi:signal transduction histidine kinase/ligand-binding sensor domain-containing protein